MTFHAVDDAGLESPAPLPRSRLSLQDVVRVGLHGLRTRPTRALLSALGIAIGIAAMVSVVGISASSRAQLDDLLSRLGTNMLTVAPGNTLSGTEAQLPMEAPAMIERIKPVRAVSATGLIEGTFVYRSDRIPAAESNSISVLAAETDLPATVGATVRSGAWLNDAVARFPAVVLGDAAARRLGLSRAYTDVQVMLGGRWFTVMGILDPVALAPELDSSALLGWPAAQAYLDFDGYPTTVYERSSDETVSSVLAVLPRTANPEHPEEVSVSRPSDVLAAKTAANTTLTALLLGLGAVSLLVGGVGVANTMVISVLERRSEIGLRRALGATGRHVLLQFLAEAVLLSLLGGAAGALIGVGITAGYAASQGWPAVVPLLGLVIGLTGTVLVGAVAGLYPAIRAGRLAPTVALASG
jgi:putative ABC transport system permease protein